MYIKTCAKEVENVLVGLSADRKEEYSHFKTQE